MESKSSEASDTSLVTKSNSTDSLLSGIGYTESTTLFTSTTEATDIPVWYPWKGLYIHLELFRKGLVVISSTNGNDGRIGIDGGFSFKKGQFSFFPINEPHKTLKATVKLTQQLLDYATKEHSSTRIQPLKSDALILVNTKRREETFLPIIFNLEPKMGLYLYPWATRAVDFHGCSQFVTAGCLFGASMIGKLNNGDEIKFIDHHREWGEGEIITSIMYDPGAPNPFELVVFSECKKICFLIESFVAKDQTKKLLYHLPAYDYILFGVNLYIKKHITFEALDTFIQYCFIKKEQYQQTIGAICAEHEIEVQFHSPFDNIFHGISSSSILSQEILDYLHVTPDFSEQNLVNTCVAYLRDNAFLLLHQEVWFDFITHVGDDIVDIEELFKMGNSVLVATASRGLRNFETCLLLPLSEKQIQVGYDKCCKQLAKQPLASASIYPNLLNLTVFDPVIADSHHSEGLLFYFRAKLDILATMIATKGVVNSAASNLASPTNIELESLLPATPLPSILPK